MLAHPLSLGDGDEAVEIDAQADAAIGERGRHAVAVALEINGGRTDVPENRGELVASPEALWNLAIQ